MVNKSKHDEIVELVNKLFVYTDNRDWEKLQKEVFTEKVHFDMSSAGGGAPTQMTAIAICDMWKHGFEGIDHVHHHSGNYIVKFPDDVDVITADVLCYATAIHYRKNATLGQTREFVGSYNIHTSFTDRGWRIDSFRYNLKYISGNAELK